MLATSIRMAWPLRKTMSTVLPGIVTPRAAAPKIALPRQSPREVTGTAADIEQRSPGSRLERLANEPELDITDPLAA